MVIGFLIGILVRAPVLPGVQHVRAAVEHFWKALPRAHLNSSIGLHFVPALDPLPVREDLELIFS